MKEKQECLCARFFGRVQGVNFRYFVQEIAQSLEIDGWVRNCGDGSVEIEAFGSREKLEKLLEELQKKQGLASVEKIESRFCRKESPAKGFKILF